GLGVTAVIQSSSATTVMVVGFVNSGLMQLRQAIGVIMGANIGTTVTAWLLSLTGIDGDGIFLRLLKPSSFTPVLALIGTVMLMVPRFSKRRDIGTVLLGFAVLMTGMDTMSAAVKPLAGDESFARIFLLFENPILGVLAGALLTAVIQSSSASVGILQALAVTGSITFAGAIPIIMGQNIGTCITALLSSVGTGRNARRAALVHLYFNLIGTIVCLCAFTAANAIFDFAFASQPVDALWIAIIHSIFNVSCTAILLPMGTLLEKLAIRTIPDEKSENDTTALLDESLFAVPAVAVERSREVICEMARTVEQNLLMSLALLVEPSEKLYAEVCETEAKIDNYEDCLGSYLVNLGTCDLNAADSRALSCWLHSITDLERIGDHAMSIAEHAQEMAARGQRFSDEAKEELRVITDAIIEIVSMTNAAFRYGDLRAARAVEPLEQVIDGLDDRIKDNHIRRLREGKCTLDSGIGLYEILNGFERISDHCSNIAVCQLANAEENLDTHAYLSAVKTGSDSDFESSYRAYGEKYTLPQG
ncbi:MAG: Na/Pi cotransporter family protein, partial [Oscillospiraceae bacterium]|nr:Na/Pi cotransporter family protein [Oscillospiraceae bacterium]